jgi:hypothetical protein
VNSKRRKAIDEVIAHEQVNDLCKEFLSPNFKIPYNMVKHAADDTNIPSTNKLQGLSLNITIRCTYIFTVNGDVFCPDTFVRNAIKNNALLSS